MRKSVTIEHVIGAFLKNKDDIFLGGLLSHYVRFFSSNVLKYGFYNRSELTIGSTYFSDIVNDTITHVLINLSKFDPAKGLFRNWSYSTIYKFVTNSYKKYYKSGKQFHLDNFEKNNSQSQMKNMWKDISNKKNSTIEIKHIQIVNRKSMQEILREEFKDTLKKLIKTYSKYEELLKQMYGDPFDTDYSVNTKLNISKICRDLGLNSANTMFFLQTKIYPELEPLKKYVTVGKIERKKMEVV